MVEGRVPEDVEPKNLPGHTQGVIAIEDTDQSLTTSIELPVELLTNTLRKMEMTVDMYIEKTN